MRVVGLAPGWGVLDVRGEKLHGLDQLFASDLTNKYRAMTGRERPRLCENACAVLKSALLRKICQRLVNQQTGNLRRSAIFVPVLTVKPAPKCFHTAWTQSGH